MIQARVTVGCLLAVLLSGVLIRGDETGSKQLVTVEIFEGIPEKQSWEFKQPETSIDLYSEQAFALVWVPTKYTDKGLISDRGNPFFLQASGQVQLPAANYRLLLRAKSAIRLYIDGQLVLETEFLDRNSSGHDSVPDLSQTEELGLPRLLPGHKDRMGSFQFDDKAYDVRIEAVIGGKNMRPELGELVVAVSRDAEPFELLGGSRPVRFDDEGWSAYLANRSVANKTRDTQRRRAAATEWARYWDMRHELARQEWSGMPAPEVPDVSDRPGVEGAIDRFIGQRLEQKGVTQAPMADDYKFLRRVTLDIVGVIPTPGEIDAFFRDGRRDRRSRLIDRLLDDPRWADHWVGYWQDVLAENPGIVKPKLNNTGPFRQWIYESFLDGNAMDRFATELVLMEGSKYGGGPAGFAMATLNDAPMAAKSHIISKAFLGLELQCARCHDAPYHPFQQKDLFSLAAMLRREPQAVPATSSIRISERARRPLVKVTLEPGTKVDPAWPFLELASPDVPAGILQDPNDPRERLAAILTRNQQFAEVLVNRLWKRYMAYGLVEPVDDWVDREPSHPNLLAYLARELVTHNYDLKHLARLILNSQTYQRMAPTDSLDPEDPQQRLFAGQSPRRMSAEQLVDSLFLAVEKKFRTEQLCMDPEGRRPASQFVNLGTPRRAWQFTTLSNERDRPALALPMTQTFVDLLKDFGWRDARQNPITVRDQTPAVTQPMSLAHGLVGRRITRLSDDSGITELCLQSIPVEELVERVFLKMLSRPPSEEETEMFVDLLSAGYQQRRVPGAKPVYARQSRRFSAVSWSNHLHPEATEIKLEMEQAARAGDPATKRLEAEWRERMEDMLWCLTNSPEFLFMP